MNTIVLGCVCKTVCISLRITIFTYVKLVEESSHSIDATCISLRFCLFERTKKWGIENSERMENWENKKYFVFHPMCFIKDGKLRDKKLKLTHLCLFGYLSIFFFLRYCK